MCSQVWDGVLDEEMKVLVEIIAKTGLGDWEAKREELQSRLGKAPTSQVCVCVVLGVQP